MKTKLTIGILSVLATAVLIGCGPSEEEKKLIDTLNRHKAITDRDAHVERVQLITSEEERAEFRKAFDRRRGGRRGPGRGLRGGGRRPDGAPPEDGPGSGPRPEGAPRSGPGGEGQPPEGGPPGGAAAGGQPPKGGPPPDGQGPGEGRGPDRGGEGRDRQRRERKGNDVPFRAKILDASGTEIGEVLGLRVEGFGTRVFQTKYYDEEASSE